MLGYYVRVLEWAEVRPGLEKYWRNEYDRRERVGIGGTAGPGAGAAGQPLTCLR